MIQTDIHVEYTDTFNREANYCWVKREVIPMPIGKEYSDYQAIRLAKKAIGLNGIRCKKENMGDTIALYPYGLHTVCFIDFFAHGRCDIKGIDY